MSYIPDVFAVPLIEAHNERVARIKANPYLRAMADVLGDDIETLPLPTADSGYRPTDKENP